MIQYDPHSWWEHFFDLKGSMLREIAPRVLLVALWAEAICYVHLSVRPVDIPVTGHSLVGLVLSLLLVFRTNSSYDRFWEGRKLWGSIVNETRNLARAARTQLVKDPAAVSEIVRWTSALPWAVVDILRSTRTMVVPLRLRLGAAGEAAFSAPHPGLAVALELSEQIRRARDRGLITDYVMISLDQNVQLLVDFLGGCERIHRTPLPFAYVVHLRRLVLLYLFTLPFALVKDFGWLTGGACLLLAYALFGIEETGVEIENPFGVDSNDLPLERICETIEGNLREFLPDESTSPGDVSR